MFRSMLAAALWDWATLDEQLVEPYDADRKNPERRSAVIELLV